MRVRGIVGVLVALLVSGSSMVVAMASPPKPERVLVPSGATVMYWTYPGSVGPSGSGSGPSLRYFTLDIHNAVEIERVRTMINAIPAYYVAPGTMCNDLAMRPFRISFSKGSQSASFTVVSFQLGGCGSATVYQDGVAQSPLLGGKGLLTRYETIQKVISPNGVPLT